MHVVAADVVLVCEDWGASPCRALYRKILLLGVDAPLLVNSDLESAKVVAAVGADHHEMADADMSDQADPGDRGDLAGDIAELGGVADGVPAEAAVADAVVQF